ncbi:MAG: sigma-70 factor domain-containing protein [Limisphaerales bacterium]
MPVLWRQKIKKPKTVKVARRIKNSAPAEPKPGAYVIPEPDAPKTAEGDLVGGVRVTTATRPPSLPSRIGQVKLLTPDEEIQLAARIKKGDKKAREHMIKANLRLVVKNRARL